ncbi:MAG: histidinol dehydrogenase [Planctomycetes bacterium]|nr:histidinol dehydrogenase [Planctomycetota bacterium]
MSDLLPIRTYSPADERFQAIVRRGGDIDADLGVRVAEIIASIRAGGGESLLDLVRRYDAPLPDLASLRVTPAEVAAAAAAVDPALIDAVRRAAANITAFHQHQLRRGYRHHGDHGAVLEKRVLPLARVGVYCPAGTAPLFSSLLMNVVPARIAGVGAIAVAIPPRRDGSVDPNMLATAQVLGLEEIWKMGGAQAIAAFAYGAGPVHRVDKIVGPGNAYVATAKRQVFGVVGIDSVAGPSEIVVIADADANPRFIAADLLSQVEHGSGYESGVVLTDDAGLAREVAAETERMVAELERADTVRRALSRYGAIFLCRDIDQALDAANLLAPEHLEIVTRDPRRHLERVVNAGAVFLGPWSTEPVGDYFAGTNHVLPTTGAARYASSLGVADFLKDISVIDYPAEALRQAGPHIMLMAAREGLTAHANAVGVRLDALSSS